MLSILNTPSYKAYWLSGTPFLVSAITLNKIVIETWLEPNPTHSSGERLQELLAFVEQGLQVSSPPRDRAQRHQYLLPPI